MRRFWLILTCCLWLAGCGGSSTPAPPAPPTPLTIVSVYLAPADLGESYSQQLVALGGTAPYKWSVISGALPLGMQLTTGGLLEGTPHAGGMFSFEVQVVDSSTGTAVSEILN